MNATPSSVRRIAADRLPMSKTAGADALARYAKRSGCAEQVRGEHARYGTAGN